MVLCEKRFRIMRLSQSVPRPLFLRMVVESWEWTLVSSNVFATRWHHPHGMPVTSIHQTLTHDYTAATETHRVCKSCARKYCGEITNNLPAFII
jgi:hypothetical protein